MLQSTTFGLKANKSGPFEWALCIVQLENNCDNSAWNSYKHRKILSQSLVIQQGFLDEKSLANKYVFREALKLLLDFFYCKTLESSSKHWIFLQQTVVYLPRSVN